MKPAIQPLGVGDLKVVKTRLVRYEAGEVAHIENVLAREKREREHRRLRQIEEIVTVEQEREEENRRDLQSTERFELQTEVERTLRSETSFEAGLELSAGYGPVRLGAFARFSSTEAKEESDRTATDYAKEVTDKTLRRLVERVREERRVRTLEEVEETNTHGYDNSGSGDHVTGVYRWVDKYYRAKVVNYGKRLLYEFIVPEPAAYYLYATRTYFQSSVLPVKPAEPTVPGGAARLTPAAITRTNYLWLAQEYGAEGIEPPPPGSVVIAKTLAREFQQNQAWAFANEDLEVPRGYVATHGAYRYTRTWIGTPTFGSVTISQTFIDLFGPATALPLGGQAGKIGISGTGFNVVALALNVEAVCSLIAEHYQRWQLATYQAIMTAYRRALAEYEERVAAAQIQQGGRVGGDNPLLNRATERDELKWLCLVLWAEDALFNPPGITQTPGGPPWPHRPNALGNATKIEFFEEAFEWQNVTVELYPYFWGRDESRPELLSLESEDPLFERFLKAGAARVVVPVRPSRTDAVLWYQLTGTIWTGGPVPALTSTGAPEATLYNSYLQDMQGVEDVEDLGADVPIDASDPTTWLLQVPTTLVWLQEDATLPDFEAVT